ncbi:hypothetical protein LCGC14_0748740 [marine sediment metagenome]|uniref:Uncharacterized protein n=1 Tax=marine sediment metagenome TaxID=412755 RepID=A0A0F9TBL8_9ZZZZ
MTKKFTLEIEFGTDGMRDGIDIAITLQGIADHLSHKMKHADLKPFHSRVIRDLHGDTVGAWNIVLDP